MKYGHHDIHAAVESSGGWYDNRPVHRSRRDNHYSVGGRYVKSLLQRLMMACAICAIAPQMLLADAASPVATSADPGASTPQTGRLTLKELDERFGWRGWNIPFFSYANTLTQDTDGWRSTLAQYGIGFLALDLAAFSVNMLNTPLTNPKGQQTYWGQRGSVNSQFAMFLTFDLSRYGIPDGQIQIGSDLVNSTWHPYIPTNYGFYRLAYYQSFFDRKVELNVGYLSNAQTFVGIYVGGQMQNPFGPSSSIPIQLGLSAVLATQPTLSLKYNMTENLYNHFGVARSLSPTASVIYDSVRLNPVGLDFDLAGARALYIDEIGYKQVAKPNKPYTWFRAGGIYNSSLFKNYDTGGRSTNSGFYALFDRQFVQFEPTSSTAAHRGIYGGVSFMYAPPQTNIFSQYYEARLYSFGLFDSRPNDMISLVYQHNVLSSYYADATNRTAVTTGTYARHASNSITTSYLWKFRPGLSLTVGATYTDNPSVTYTKGQGHAFNFLASTFIAF